MSECPTCNSKAYVGFLEIECSNLNCNFYNEQFAKSITEPQIELRGIPKELLWTYPQEKEILEQYFFPDFTKGTKHSIWNFALLHKIYENIIICPIEKVYSSIHKDWCCGLSSKWNKQTIFFSSSPLAFGTTPIKAFQLFEGKYPQHF